MCVCMCVCAGVRVYALYDQSQGILEEIGVYIYNMIKQYMYIQIYLQRKREREREKE